MKHAAPPPRRGRRAPIGAWVATLAAVLAACSATATSATQPSSPRVGALPAAPAVAHPFGLLRCLPRYGIRFCRGGQFGGEDLRVRSFDGVPLDADVALPPTGRGPFPLIVLLHGLGGSKSDWEVRRDDGGLDDVTLARAGYAVLMYTARGFGDSCGTAASRLHTPACARGYVRLADQRYEVRDTQYLAGLLVDEGLVRPDIAVAGVSYGAGQALELAMLKDRIRLPDGAFAAWTSPVHHVPMRVAAVYAEWPWYDLATALVPNGHLVTDGGPLTPLGADLRPVGVEKESWDDLLYLAASQFYLAPAGREAAADLTGWHAIVGAGEPYGRAVAAVLGQLQEYHSAAGVPVPSGGPAATVIASGWTDTLFPVLEGLHYADTLQRARVHSPLLMIFDDVGHGWAQDKPADVAAQTKEAITFLDDVMIHRAVPQSGVIVRGTTCPRSAPSGPDLSGPSLAALEAGSLSLGSPGPQVVTSGGGSPAVAAALSPAYASRYCHLLPAAREPGTAVYTRAITRTTTLLGGLVVHARLLVLGRYPELIARLWDVDPRTGRRQLVELGDYRPAVGQAATASPRSSGDEEATFELPPNCYRVPAGHLLELELVGSNAPWFRPSNGTFRITVSDLSATVGVAATA